MGADPNRLRTKPHTRPDTFADSTASVDRLVRVSRGQKVHTSSQMVALRARSAPHRVWLMVGIRDRPAGATWQGDGPSRVSPMSHVTSDKYARGVSTAATDARNPWSRREALQPTRVANVSTLVKPVGSARDERFVRLVSLRNVWIVNEDSRDCGRTHSSASDRAGTVAARRIRARIARDARSAPAETPRDTMRSQGSSTSRGAGRTDL